MDDPTVHTPALAANELRALSWLGLALRAGRIRVGSEAVFSAIRSGQAKLVVLAGDAGSNLAKKVADKCAFYQVPLRKGPDKSVLGQALGRRTVGVVAVLDAEFAERFRQSVGAIYGGEAFDETEGL
ncbi:MAG: ribosomal L7Ae/L30e/S12e/Gadd45 family protein [Alicyclobacillus herbarius]|uniref:L7Ae/L30e/S12e/Gadd45 family ribosomal protein n=1 Tax=Alicyclobacillus herbarius TaxID=122960 RepID=UPI0023522B19|nr:ribosomal L7Ae/L30e/S12e/Gadd45 family protein [Alicyclobacillus herbarius]MCL6632015.1 ribosomal L7Ae/L30e/S12e/Gadd45 family protein [Alicyclobacillus herbarius]